MYPPWMAAHSVQTGDKASLQEGPARLSHKPSLFPPSPSFPFWVQLFILTCDSTCLPNSLILSIINFFPSVGDFFPPLSVLK